jgi:hypothetical protein
MRCSRVFVLIAALLASAAANTGLSVAALAQAAGGDGKATALRPNVVKITATLGQGQVPQTGFGFIVGQQGNQLVVVTADHVVRGVDPDAEDKAPLITFFENQGSQIRGKLEAVRLQRDRGDLAVILVQKPDFVSFVTQAIDATPAARGLPVWLVGRAGDWSIPIAPGFVAQIDSFTHQIQVEGLAARVGSSGGPLISSNGIVGMIVRDSDLYTEATPIEPIQRQVGEKWHYTWQLKPGPQSAPEVEKETVEAEANWTIDEKREVQRALRMLGHFQGQADGGFGPGTRSAIKQFQSFEGNPETGTLSGAERRTLLDMSQRLTALLDQPSVSPGGMSAAAIKGTQQRYARAWSFETGKGARRNSAEAAYWYALAASDGEAKALTNLGTIVVRGWDAVKPDRIGAAVLWRAPAARGEAIAMFNLGVLYEHGIGVSADIAKARGWYLRAAAANHADARAALKRLGS